MDTPQPPPRVLPLTDETRARLARHLIKFGEQLHTLVGAISKNAATFLRVAPYLSPLSRAELRIRRVHARAGRRTRRAERRRQQRLLRVARKQQRDLARRRRQRVRAQQRAIHRLRYRGHPARTRRLTS